MPLFCRHFAPLPSASEEDFQNPILPMLVIHTNFFFAVFEKFSHALGTNQSNQLTSPQERSSLGQCLSRMYRILYTLAVCSDGMTEAKPRLFRQNRPASEYIIWHNPHSPANRCSGCSHMHLKTKEMSLDNYNVELRGQVQVLVTLTTKHDWAGIDPQV